VSDISDLDRVKALLGPPTDAAGRPVRVVPADWTEIHDHLGLRLPKSFTDFVDHFGTGHLGLLVLSHPSVEPDSPLHGWGDLLARIKWGETYLHHRRSMPCGLPYPIHPEPGGLLLWATSADEFQFFFLADPPDDPERWPILWHGVGFDTWDLIPGPFDRFLLDLITGKLPTEIVSEGHSHQMFEPFGPGVETRERIGFDPDHVPVDDD
jgi:hypothetical protein